MARKSQGLLQMLIDRGESAQSTLAHLQGRESRRVQQGRWLSTLKHVNKWPSFALYIPGRRQVFEQPCSPSDVSEATIPPKDYGHRFLTHFSRCILAADDEARFFASWLDAGATAVSATCGLFFGCWSKLTLKHCNQFVSLSMQWSNFKKPGVGSSSLVPLLFSRLSSAPAQCHIVQGGVERVPATGAGSPGVNCPLLPGSTHPTNLPSLPSILYLSLSLYLFVYRSICLSICLSLPLPTYLSVYQPIYLSIYFLSCRFISWSIHLFLCLSIHLFTYLSISIHLPIYQSIGLLLSTHLSFFLSIYLSIHLPTHPSIYLPLYLSICLSIYLSCLASVHLSRDLSIYLPMYLPIYLSFVYLSSYLFVCLSILLSLSLSLSLYLPLHPLHLPFFRFPFCCLSVHLSYFRVPICILYL